MRRVATENPTLVRGLQAAGQSGGGGTISLSSVVSRTDGDTFPAIRAPTFTSLILSSHDDSLRCNSQPATCGLYNFRPCLVRFICKRKFFLRENFTNLKY